MSNLIEKTCNKCNETKAISEFQRARKSYSDGYNGFCKFCLREVRFTEVGFLKYTYKSMFKRHKKHSGILIDRDSFIKFSLNDGNFKKLFIIYKSKNLNKIDKGTISIDRINNNIGYCKNNLQWITHSENVIKHNINDKVRKCNIFCYKGHRKTKDTVYVQSGCPVCLICRRERQKSNRNKTKG